MMGNEGDRLLHLGHDSPTLSEIRRLTTLLHRLQ